MVSRIGRATASAIRSGALIAMVLGNTSAKITTSTVMTRGGVEHADLAEPTR